MTEVARLDHAGLVGRDIGVMLAASRRLGFAPTVPQALMGRDPASGTIVSLQQTSAHLVLGTGYIELAAVHSDSPAHHLAAYLGRYQGLHILALGVADIHAAHARCVTSGLQPRALARASRRIEYGERHGDAQFEWFMLEPSCSPEGLVCFVRQVTPGLVFQPAVQSHPNGATALAGVYLVARDPEALAARLAAATGGRIRAGEDGAWVDIQGGWLGCLQPESLGRRFAGEAAPACPAMAGLCIAVRDPDAAREIATASGLTPRVARQGYWIGAGEAAGCVFEFTAAAAPD